MFGNTSRALTFVSLYSPPNEYLLQHTHKTLVVCRYQEDSLLVIDAKSILSVVAMIPFPFIVGGHDQQHFVVERVGLDVLEACDNEEE